jgi:hypothetical protein
MRGYKDYDSALKALADKTRKLKEQRTRQLGELVAATGADALDTDTLAGALLHAVNTHDAATKEAWRVMGAGFFRDKRRKAPARSRGDHAGAQAEDSDAASD